MLSQYRKLLPIVALFGILGAIFAPPWVPLLVIVILALSRWAWVVIPLALTVDFLWLPAGSGSGLFGSLVDPVPLFTIGGIVLAWILEPLRSEFMTR